MDKPHSGSNLSESSHATVTLLLVESDESDRAIYRRCLQGQGDFAIHLLQAGTIADGRSHWQTYQPDIALIDPTLSDEDGWELLASMAAGGTVTIALVAASDQAATATAMQRGAVACVAPETMTADGLTATVRQAWQGVQLHRQLARSRQQATVLATIARRVQRSLPLAALLQQTVEDVRACLAADRVAVYQAQSDIGMSTVVAEATIDPWPTCVQQTVTGILEECGWAIADVATATAMGDRQEWLTQLQVQAELAVPIDRPPAETPPQWGWLVAHQCEQPRSWQIEDEEFLQQVAVQLAIALQQAQLDESRRPLNAALESKVAQRTQELKASRNRFLGIFENMFQFIGLLSPEGILLEANQTALQAGGLTREAVVGRPFWTTGWWQISAQTQAQLRAAIATAAAGEFVRYEVDVLGAKGTIIPIDFSLRPVKDEAGQVILLIPEGRDLTALRRAQAEQTQTLNLLRRSQRRYASLMAVAPVGIFRADTSGRCIYANDRYSEITGLSLAGALGEAWQRQLHPDDREAVLVAWRQTVTTGEPFRHEYRFQHADGTVVWVYGQAVAEQNDQGLRVGFVGSLTDISDRKQAELALHENQQFLEAVATASPNILYVYDVQWQRNIYVNRAVATILGCSPEAVQAMGDSVLSSLMHPDDFGRYPDHLARLEQAQPGEVIEFEYRMRCTSGEWCWLSSRDVVFSRDEQGRVRQIVGTALDITERKRAEIALIESEGRSQAILSAIPDLMVRVSRQGIYRGHVAQRSELDIIPTTIDAIGRSMREVLPADIADRKLHYLRRALETGELQIFDQQVWIGDRLQYEEVRVVRVTPDEVLFMIRDISDRKWAEQERLATEQIRGELRLVESILDNVLAGYWDWDIPNGNEYLSLGFKRMFGYEDHELPNVPESWQQIIFPEDLPRVMACFDRHVDSHGEVPFYNEVRYRHKDGSTVWVICSGRVIEWDAEGQPRRMIGCHIDISERKRLEAAREQAQEKIALQLTAIESAMDGIGILKDDRYIYLNQAHLDLFGCDQVEDLIGKTWRELYQPAEIAKFEQEILPVLRRDRRWHGETVAVRRDGTPFMQELSLTLGTDDVLICVCRDISDRKQAEAELRTSRALYEAIVADQTELICRFLPDGTLTFVNDAYCKFFQRSADELIGKTLTPLLPEEDADQSAQPFDTLSVDRPVVTSEHQVIAPDGRPCWQQWTKRALFAPDGSVIKYQAVGREITALKEAEARLRHTNEELLQATRLKDEFFANMSHELRTPLNAILGMSEGLQEEVFGAISDRQRQALQTIEQGGAHLLELINDILDLAKIESGFTELFPTVTNTSALCQASLALVRQQADHKHIRLATHLPPDVPDLWVDERRIRQVLINLLNNAVKFTPAGGQVTLAVERSPDQIEPDDPCIRISVIDTGIGIAPENMSKLFLPFVQIDSALNRKFEGTGLGLALVKSTVELHGGKVSVTSEVGVGSCFSVDLPCAESGVCALPTPKISAPNHTEAAQPAIAAPLILLVEDNAANVWTTTSYLEAKGYAVVAAMTGQAGLDAARTHRPALILIDIQMPDMDGFEVIQHLRQNSETAAIPIVALTALVMAGDRDRCLAAGADEYISKPVKLRQLSDTIQNLIAASRRRGAD